MIEPASSATRLAAPLPPLPKMLAGQKALVTGANSGIGAAVALALGQAGADVAVNYVSGDDAAQAVVDQIAALGVKALPSRAPLSCNFPRWRTPRVGTRAQPIRTL